MSEVERYAFVVSEDYVGAKPREDGAYVLYGDYTALQKKLDTVLAENFSLLNFDADEFTESGPYQCDNPILEQMKTPTTDALLNAVRAEGVDIAADFLIKADTVGSTGAMGHALHNLSSELRAKTDTTPSQYESLAGGK